jgi:hypothetical protein
MFFSCGEKDMRPFGEPETLRQRRGAAEDEEL